MLLQLNDETMNKKPGTGQTTVSLFYMSTYFIIQGSKNGDAFLVKTFIKLDALNSTEHYK